MDCIFCKIINDEIPSSTLYEDDLVRVILDINPAVKGHALMLPKAHFSSMLEADDDTRNAVFNTAARVGKKMEETLGCDGINILTNIREGAGQSIDHFHVHVLPRYKDQPSIDGLQISQKAIEAPDFDALVKALSL